MEKNLSRYYAKVVTVPYEGKQVTAIEFPLEFFKDASLMENEIISIKVSDDKKTFTFERTLYIENNKEESLDRTD